MGHFKEAVISLGNHQQSLIEQKLRDELDTLYHDRDIVLRRLKDAREFIIKRRGNNKEIPQIWLDQRDKLMKDTQVLTAKINKAWELLK